MKYEPEYYTVGELAKNYGLPVSTLRFYDREGIFVPEYRNPENGYRYYSSDQLLMLDVILFLRELGVATNKIPQLTKNAKSRTDLMAALRAHNAEIRERIETLAAIGEKIEAVDRQFTSADLSTGQMEEKLFPQRIFFTKQAVDLPTEGADRRFRFRQNVVSGPLPGVASPPMRAMGVIYALRDLRRTGVLICSRQFVEYTDPVFSPGMGEKTVIPAGRYLTLRFRGLPGERVAAWNRLLRRISETGLKTGGELIEANANPGMPPVAEAEEILEFQLRMLE